MTGRLPPETVSPDQADATGQVSAASPSLSVLQRRADFLRAASARRQGTAGFLLQARHRRADEPVAADSIRIGYTCSKKLGNAVARNRAKRRLREIARSVLPEAGQPGWDYVLVGRPEATATREFDLLKRDLRAALSKVHSGKEAEGGGTAPPGRRRGRG